MSEAKREVLRDLLEEHKSAPSAVNFLLSHLLDIDCVSEINSKFMDTLYESGEGANDMVRDALMNYFDEDKLDFLIADIIKYCKENTEPGDCKECYCSIT